MRHALFVLLLIAAGTCISSASLDSALYEVNMTVNVSNGVMYAHIPVSTAWQTVTPLEEHAIFEDDAGSYAKLEGFQTLRFLVEVKSANARPSQDQPLPLTLPADVQKFLEPTAKIQSNDAEIQALAKQIVGNSTTELEAVSRIVEWVYTNVDYFVQEDRLGKMSAAEVLRAKRGVCGDFSVLAAAFLRGLGVPAKYVNGELYTGKEFQPHAWLEVYVPDSGWTPVDPTNGKIMPTAALIKIMEGADPADLADTVVYRGETPVSYKNFSSSFVHYSQFSSLFNTSVTIKPQRAAFNQTVKITLNLENLQGRVLAPDVRLYRTAELEVNDTFKIAVLPPRGKTSLEWQVMTPAGLDPAKVYTFYAIIEGPGFSHNASLYVSSYVMKPPSVANVESYVNGSVLVLSISVQNQAPYEINATVSVDSELGRADKIVDLSPWETDKAEFKFPVQVGREYVFRINTSTPDAQTFFSTELRVQAQPPWEQNLLIPLTAVLIIIIALSVFLIRWRMLTRR